MIILEENFKWHLEAFASELFICRERERERVRLCVFSILVGNST